MKWDIFSKNTENKDQEDLQSAFSELDLEDHIEEVEEIKEETYVYMPALHIDENTSIIQSDTAIIGNVDCEDDLIIYGSVQGDINCNAKLCVYGTITGNIHAKSLEMSASTIYGNVSSDTECILVDEDAIIHGSVKAELCDIKGKIKGNIDCKTSLVLGNKSVVLGDIITATIQISQGAVLRGQIIMNQATSFKGEL